MGHRRESDRSESPSLNYLAHVRRNDDGSLLLSQRCNPLFLTITTETRGPLLDKPLHGVRLSEAGAAEVRAHEYCDPSKNLF